MSLGKKGTEEIQLSKTITELIVSVLIVGVMAMLLRVYFTPVLHETQTRTDPRLTSQIVIERLTNNCFVHQDSEIKRVYPGIIDLALFDKEHLKKCFGDKLPLTGLKLMNLLTKEEQSLLLISPAEQTIYVLIYNDKKISPAKLTIYWV